MPIDYGSNDVSTSGNVNVSGVVTATSGNFTNLLVNGNSFNSSVSGLLPTIANSGDNRILTSTGTSTGINAESNATFDGTNLVINSGLTASTGNFTTSISGALLNVDNIRIDGNTISSTNSNGSIIIQPSGTGAIQRNSGGNSRGQYSIDLQAFTTSGNQVASGHHSVIGGGSSNIVTGNGSVINGGALAIERTIGGFYNDFNDGLYFDVFSDHGLKVGDTVIFNTNGALPNPLVTGTIYYAVSGPYSNYAGGSVFTVSSTSGGSPVINNYTYGSGTTTYTITSPTSNNIIESRDSIINGGFRNTIVDGSAGIIGGGNNNTIESNHGTIAGGNRNTISAYAYSCTIGGGSNNIIGSGNFPGHSTIGGGSNNSVSGYTSTFSTIGGGSNNSVSGSSAGSSTIGGGNNNSVSGSSAGGSTIGGGSFNSVSGTNSQYSSIGGGSSNSVSGTNSAYSTIGGGFYNSVSGTNSQYSTIPGGLRAAATRYGELCHAAGRFANDGDAQHSIFVLRGKTTNASQTTTLGLDGSTTSRLTIASGAILSGTINIIGSISTGANVARYLRQFTIKNVGGTTSLVGSIITLGTDEASGTTISITADDANDALSISVTRSANETWRWVAVVDCVQMRYGT